MCQERKSPAASFYCLQHRDSAGQQQFFSLNVTMFITSLPVPDLDCKPARYGAWTLFSPTLLSPTLLSPTLQFSYPPYSPLLLSFLLPTPYVIWSGAGMSIQGTVSAKHQCSIRSSTMNSNFGFRD